MLNLVHAVQQKGGRKFVLNAPWQVSLLPKARRLNLWAGPFCNITNGLAVEELKSLGFSGIIVSPELGKQDYQELPGQSPLPLGIVLTGHWPLCTSRTLSEDIPLNQAFFSPKGEAAWVTRHDWDYWVYPNWKLDLSAKRNTLIKMGFRCFVHLEEPVPNKVSLKKRPGLWNWDVGMR